MSPKELDAAYQCHKKAFHTYIQNIKAYSPNDIFTILNTTLIKNPYVSEFPKNYFNQFFQKTAIYQQIFSFLTSTIFFYFKNFYKLFLYLISHILYKLYYYPQDLKYQNTIVLDLFFLVDSICQNGKFEEHYFASLYPVLETNHKNYIFLPRLYGIHTNPFKLIPFFKILNQKPPACLFEYELFHLKEYWELIILLFCYPFKTLRILQQNKTLVDCTFNRSLLQEIKKANFEEFTRYLFGKKLAQFSSINTIYSWGEFQAIERGFNYAIRTTNPLITLSACRFYIETETELNIYIDDIDILHKSAPHKVLVNGKHYLTQQKEIEYFLGVSLRYANIFHYQPIKEKDAILLLGAYSKQETKYLLMSCHLFPAVIFKNHPALDFAQLGTLPNNITCSKANIYTLFQTSKLAIGTASGSLLEAVACGVSVIVIASNDNLTANPLVAYGQGKIWDIAFNSDDVIKIYDKLIKYRNNHTDEVQKIAMWYKENFFIEPTEENIIKTFELDKD